MMIATIPELPEQVAMSEFLAAIESLKASIELGFERLSRDNAERHQDLQGTYVRADVYAKDRELSKARHKTLESKVKVILYVFAFVATTLGGFLLAALFGGLQL